MMGAVGVGVRFPGTGEQYEAHRDRCFACHVAPLYRSDEKEEEIASD
jgi:hypothetical protein